MLRGRALLPQVAIGPADRADPLRAAQRSTGRGATYEVNRGLNADQARKLRVATENNWLKALCTLALYLGLRRGELLGLRWEDIDLNNKFLEIRQTLQRVDGELRAVTPKTRRSRRTVPRIDLCVDDLREHLERQARERKSAGESPCGRGSGVVGDPLPRE
jgi:integrase